ILDSHVAMPDSLAVIIILQANKAETCSLFRIRPGHDEPAIHAHGISLAAASDFVAIPLPQWFGIGFGRRLERVDRPCAPGRIFWVGVTYLHLVTLMNGAPRIVLGVREAKKHTRIGYLLFLHKLSTKHEIRKLAPRVPPQSHPPFAG